MATLENVLVEENTVKEAYRHLENTGLLLSCIFILYKDNERLRIVSKPLIPNNEKQRALVW